MTCFWESKIANSFLPSHLGGKQTYTLCFNSSTAHGSKINDGGVYNWISSHRMKFYGNLLSSPSEDRQIPF